MSKKESKLSQILAIEKGVKQRVYAATTEAHKLNQKASGFNGFSKVYAPSDEDGEPQPDENVLVQRTVTDSISEYKELVGDLMDVTLTKDAANRNAVADLVVDGAVIAKDVPATNLLFLEKQLNDVKAFVEALPVLDPASSWANDPNTGLFKSSPEKTNRTKKVQKPVVLHAPTDKHPAQTQMITEDCVVGSYTMTKMSGAMPAPEKKAILRRVDSLLRAVQKAREEANTVDAPRVVIGAPLFNFLFKS